MNGLKTAPTALLLEYRRAALAVLVPYAYALADELDGTGGVEAWVEFGVDEGDNPCIGLEIILPGGRRFACVAIGEPPGQLRGRAEAAIAELRALRGGGD